MKKDKTKLGACGGFGDALYVLGEIQQKYNVSEVSLVHARKDKLPINDSIKEFYESQDLEAEVVVRDNHESWVKENYAAGRFEAFINKDGSHYSLMANQLRVKYELLHDTPKTILVPRAGRDERNKREFSIDSVNQFLEFHKREPILLLGDTNQEYVDALVTYPEHTNLMNKTKVKDLVNLICSSETLIGHPGFLAYLAAMTGKTVRTTVEPHCSHLYFNPNWDVTFIRGI